jgi:hypothetical protein
VTTVREDCFRGERLRSIPEARERALTWSLREIGLRRHTRTGRMPLEHFTAVEKACLLPPPAEPYDIPKWSDPKVGPDQHAVVCKALYSLSRQYRRKKLRARADKAVVRFYFKGELIYACGRVPPGGRYTNPEHFPPEQLAYATRDTEFLRRQATNEGPAVGRFADALLAGPLPWTKMRQVFALLGLCRRFGAGRVNETCTQALAAEMHDTRRLERMIKLALPSSPQPQAHRANVVPIARYLRPSIQYALPLAECRASPEPTEGGNKP